jgi:hypothetical protein
MLYTLFTVAVLCINPVNNEKIGTTKPELKKELTPIEKILNAPMHYKISEKVKYFKVPTRWERT